MVIAVTPTSSEGSWCLGTTLQVLRATVGVGVWWIHHAQPLPFSPQIFSLLLELITNHSSLKRDWETLWGGSACAEGCVAGHNISFLRVWLKAPCWILFSRSMSYFMVATRGEGYKPKGHCSSYSGGVSSFLWSLLNYNFCPINVSLLPVSSLLS